MIAFIAISCAWLLWNLEWLRRRENGYWVKAEDH